MCLPFRGGTGATGAEMPALSAMPLLAAAGHQHDGLKNVGTQIECASRTGRLTILLITFGPLGEHMAHPFRR